LKVAAANVKDERKLDRENAAPAKKKRLLLRSSTALQHGLPSQEMLRGKSFPSFTSGIIENLITVK